MTVYSCSDNSGASRAREGGRLALRMRAVHRAVSDLRRGTPVLLDAQQPLLVAAAETVGAAGLDEFNAFSHQDACLILAASRASAVLRRPTEAACEAVALDISPDLWAPEALRSLADPTVEQLVARPPETAELPHAALAALSLAKLARLLPAVVAMPVVGDWREQAATQGLLTVCEADIQAYPLQAAAHLTRVAQASVPLQDAPETRVVAFRAPDAGIEHLAILIGCPEDQHKPLVRLHSECFTGDLLGSLRCDCGPQLRGAIARMGQGEGGILLYLAQEGRGIGLVNKLRAYALQDRGMDTLDANQALGWGVDERNFLIAATMLRALGVGQARLLTNNPEKVEALQACGIEVEREPHRVAPNGVNDHYLATKATRFGHLLG